MKRWTNKENETLKKYIASGMSQSEIATKMKRTIYSVRSHIYEKDYSKSDCRRWTIREHNLIIEAYRNGTPTKRIAFDMGTTHANIRMMIYNARKKGLVGYRNNVRSVSGAQCQN